MFDSIDFNNIICQECSHHDWSYHASYNRNFYIGDLKIKMTIKRVICNHCGKTHSVLFYDMIPFMSISFTDLIDIIYSDSPYLVTDSSHVSYLKVKVSETDVSDYFSFCLFNSRNLTVIST